MRSGNKSILFACDFRLLFCKNCVHFFKIKNRYIKIYTSFYNICPGNVLQLKVNHFLICLNLIGTSLKTRVCDRQWLCSTLACRMEDSDIEKKLK